MLGMIKGYYAASIIFISTFILVCIAFYFIYRTYPIEYKFELDSVNDSKDGIKPRLCYVDQDFRIIFEFKEDHIEFMIKNMSDKEIFISWDKAVFLSEGFLSEKLYLKDSFIEFRNHLTYQDQANSFLYPGTYLKGSLCPYSNLVGNKSKIFSN